MKLKKYKEKSISSFFTRELIIIIISVITAFLIINHLSKLSNKLLLPIAEAETKKYVSKIINEATEEISFEGELFTINKDSSNEIKMITYNSFEATKLINEITERIEREFYQLENHNNKKNDEIIVTEIPVGVIFGNKLIGNIGPKIKIKTNIIGDALSELETEVKPYGINNALIEVRVNLDVTARVVLPFISKEIKVNNKIPISINIVNGKIPEAYLSSYK